MKDISLILYLEINDTDYIFYVGKNDEQNNFKTVFELKTPLKGVTNNRISDSEEAFKTIKENIYLIEQKFNHTFKEIILILDNFSPTFINLTGFKKLNGSQILKENITYILNTLKSCVNNIEYKKTVLHIFNTKFYLDNKKIENLPIGLFGDFYSHELSFTLINTNDMKNLNSVFDKCNLKVKKILIKSFIRGANISDNYKNKDTFFQITMNKNSSKIFYFENNSLKLEQCFNFGTDIIIQDISKITSLKIDTVKTILDQIEVNENMSDNELIDEKFFTECSYRKIKKKLIYEIAMARIKEISEIMIFKNINFKYYTNTYRDIFLEINHKLQLKCLKKIYKNVFSSDGRLNINFIDNLLNESTVITAHKLVHFGWKKEAIPVSQVKKSIIAVFFDKIFG